MLTLAGNGRLTRKPELRTTSSGATVTTVSVASRRRGSDDGEPDYVDLILWDAQAAFAAEHLVKGQAVAFGGRMEPRQWTDREGNARVAIEVHAVDLEYGAKPRRAREAGAGEEDGGS